MSTEGRTSAMASDQGDRTTSFRKSDKSGYYLLFQDSQNLLCWYLHTMVQAFELGHEKTCLMSYANNKGADQPAHPRSLISAFVFRCLDSVMSLVSVTKISSLMLASVAEQASLSLTGRNLLKIRFLMTRLIYKSVWKKKSARIQSTHIVLAHHLSQSLTGWAYSIAMVRRPPVIHIFKL